MKTKRALHISVILSLLTLVFCMSEQRSSKKPTIPILYSTDLSHPHDDPDDHFDIVALYALKELDILGIILDQGQRQYLSPGRIPVEQMNALIGRNVPYAVGLSDPLVNPADDAAEQEDKFQAGVDLIIRSLERSAAPVTIITVGSLRDTVAAFNRRPESQRFHPHHEFRPSHLVGALF